MRDIFSFICYSHEKEKRIVHEKFSDKNKTVNGTAYSYITQNGQAVRQTWVSNVLDIIYDNNSAPYAMVYNGTAYYYILNQQGDVVSIIDANRNTVAAYDYDAWGKVLSSTGSLADANPIRYRGYYYDTETGLYYVSSHYYDPEIGRWISPEPNVYKGEFDENAGLIGYNVQAYRANNPVNNIDPTGEFVISTAVLIGIGIGALIGGTAGGAYGYNKAVKNNVPKGQRWKYVVGYGLGGAAIL